MGELINEFGLELAALLLAALAGLTVLDDLLADFASRIPIVGGVLAPLVRRLSGRFRSWLSERIPLAADRIVRDVEHELPGAPSGMKLSAAVSRLQAAEPGITKAEATVAVQAAVDRVKATPSLADAPAPERLPPLLDEADEARLQELFDGLLRDHDAASGGDSA